MTDALIETTRFGSWMADAPDRFDEWAQHSGNHVLSRVGAHFRAAVAFWILEGLVLAEQRLDAFKGVRTPERLANAPTRQVTLVVVLDGSLTYRAAGAPADDVAGPGDAVLLDMRRAYSFEVTQGRTVVVSLDRGVLEDQVGPLTLAGVMPRTPETGMLVDFADALVRRLPGMTAKSAAPISFALRHLLAATLRRGHPAAIASCRAGWAAAQAYMAAQPPGSLEVEAMATALGMTRTTLYRLFRGEGGVMAYDRRRRLRLLNQALAEAGAGGTLSDLGMRFGFLDLSSLSRQFRRQFGLSMSEVRRHLSPRSEPTGPAARYRIAVERFA